MNIKDMDIGCDRLLRMPLDFEANRVLNLNAENEVKNAINSKINSKMNNNNNNNNNNNEYDMLYKRLQLLVARPLVMTNLHVLSLKELTCYVDYIAGSMEKIGKY
jgi:hypothetical protein